MRVLNANKFFYRRGGSEAVMFLTREMLIGRGHEVIDFSMVDPRNEPSPDADYFAPARSYAAEQLGAASKIVDGALSIYSPVARKKLRALLAARTPDVAHLHNVYYQLTYSILDELCAHKVPIVMTLHDPHIGCPAHVLYRDGAECHECVRGAPFAAIRHRCVKGSLGASALGFAEASLNRLSRKYDKVSRFICPSAFMASVLHEIGVPDDRIDLIPNFVPDDEMVTPVENLAAEPRFLFAGQLEEHKGIEDLLNAFAKTTPETGTLVVAGRGSLEEAVRRASSANPRIHYLGYLDRASIGPELRCARAAVLPSRWPENNPMSLLEARAAAIPVIASDRGGLSELVDHEVDGLSYPGGNTVELAASLERLARDLDFATAIGRAGFRRVQRENGAEHHYDLLMASYDAAIHAGQR